VSLAPPSAQKLVVIRAAGRGVVSQTASSAVADTSSNMVYVWITDYVANTAGLAYQKAGKLQYKITPDMVSEQKNAECLNSLLHNCVLNSVHVVVVIALCLLQVQWIIVKQHLYVIPHR